MGEFKETLSTVPIRDDSLPPQRTASMLKHPNTVSSVMCIPVQCNPIESYRMVIGPIKQTIKWLSLELHYTNKSFHKREKIRHIYLLRVHKICIIF